MQIQASASAARAFRPALSRHVVELPGRSRVAQITRLAATPSDAGKDPTDLVAIEILTTIILPSLRVTSEAENAAFWDAHASDFTDYMRTLATLGVVARAQAGEAVADPGQAIEHSVAQVASDVADAYGNHVADELRRAAFTVVSALAMARRIGQDADGWDGLTQAISDFGAGMALFSGGFWSMSALIAGIKPGFPNAAQISCSMSRVGAKFAYASVRRIADAAAAVSATEHPVPDEEDLALADEGFEDAEQLASEA